MVAEATVVVVAMSLIIFFACPIDPFSNISIALFATLVDDFSAPSQEKREAEASSRLSFDDFLSMVRLWFNSGALEDYNVSERQQAGRQQHIDSFFLFDLPTDIL